MCKHPVKKLPFLIRYVPDECKSYQMCNKAVVENGGILKFVPGNNKNKKCVIKLVIIM